jgi:hypothetical protein
MPTSIPLVVTLALVVLMTTTTRAQEAVPDDWFPFEPANTNEPGLIGMADWLDAPAGKHGRVTIDGDRFVFENGTPVKFWGTNLGNLDCAPPADRGQTWADRYAKYGVNCVRLHKFIPDLMVDSSSTRFDPQHLADFDRFTANLKERGIYYGFSWIFHHNIRPDDAAKLKYPDEIMGEPTHRVLVFIAEDVQDLRAEMLTNLLRHENPHTGLPYAEDPALAFVEFQNEDSIFFYTFQDLENLDRFPTYKREFIARFNRWLGEKYRDQAGLVDAWGEAALDEGETLDAGTVKLIANPWHFGPDGMRQAAASDRTQRHLDSAAFLFEVQRAYYAKMEQAVRDAGYQGPLVASCWTTPAGLPRYLNLYTDYEVGLIDRHSYFGGKGGWRPEPGEFDNASQLGRPGTGLLSQGLLQVADRPFAFSEWNSVFPNQWAPESLTIISAYGMGLQGWDASYHFASHTRHHPEIGFARHLHDPRLWNADVPNQVGIYPAISRMVLRGDVTEADVVSTRRVSIDHALRQVPDWMNDETSSVSEGLGDFKEETSITPEAALAVGRVVVEFTDEPEPNTTADLSNHIAGDTITSTTGQLHWTTNDADRGYIRIDTPGTQALVGFHPGKAVAMEQVTITPAAQFAAIYVSAPGPDETLDQADSALITAIARVRNTGMAFNEANDELLVLGKGPMLLEPVRATLAFNRPVARVELLDHDGRPTGTQVELDPAGTLTIDGKRDRTMYYHVTFAD